MRKGGNMRKSRFNGLCVMVLLLVFIVTSSAVAGTQAVKDEAAKAASASGEKQKSTKAVPANKSALNKKCEGMQETPNATSKTDQAASDSGDAAAKKKLKDLDETPNPMESTVNKGSGKALGGEADTKCPGHSPVKAKTGTSTKATSKAALGVETGTKGQGGEPVNPQQKAGAMK